MKESINKMKRQLTEWEYVNDLHMIYPKRSQSKIRKELIQLNIFQRRHADGQQAYEEMLTITNHQGNPMQNHDEISPHTFQNDYHQKDNIQKVLVRKQRKGNPHTLLVKVIIGTATMLKSMELPQKIKNRTTI